jgi:hypothetical protein
MSRDALPQLDWKGREGDPFDSFLCTCISHLDLSALKTGSTIDASHARFVEPRSKKETSIFFQPPLVDFSSSCK